MTWRIRKNQEEFYELNISLHIEVGQRRVEYFFRLRCPSLLQIFSEAH